MRLFSTSTQVWLFLIALSLGFLIAGYEIGGRVGLFLGFAIATAAHFFIFILGDSGLLKKFATLPVEGHDPWDLIDRVHSLCEKINMPVPQIALIKSASPLAFSVARPWGRSYLAISTSLLTKLTSGELEAVLAHQIGHLQQMETFRFGAASGLVRLILGIAAFLNALWPPNWWMKRKQEPFLPLLAPLAWLFLRLGVNAKSFYQNDDLAAGLVKDKKALAEALWKLEGLSHTRPQGLPPCTSYHFFVNPQGPQAPWMEIHPPVANRIRRLIGSDTI